MSLSGSQDAKERVRDSVDIVDLVSEQIQLRRQGRNYVGLCPWHDDSRPSLQVNPERQTWKCWVCDLGGDVFSYVMQREGVEFREALQMLADRSGISLDDGRPQRQGAHGGPEDKSTLYRAMAWAAEQFHDCLLNASTAEPARRYLEERGIAPTSIEQFGIGFSPLEWTWIIDRAGTTPFTREILEAVGLVLRSERTGGWYDRFRGRVIFPIRDTQKRAIAMGGRILPELADEKSAKYINSPETRLFSKSEQLYGLDLARDVVSRSETIVIMEGYTDVVITRQYGIENVSAVLGTALGPRHLQLIKRFANRVVLVLDGDEAGQRRANEILNLFISSPIDLRIVTLPQGQDPCDFLLAHGREALQAMLDQAHDVWEHKIRMETQDLDPIRETHRANRALETILQALASSPRAANVSGSAHRLKEEQVLSRLSRHFQVDAAQLRLRLAEVRRQQRGKPRAAGTVDRNDTTSREKTNKVTLPSIERDLIELLLQQPESVPAAMVAINKDQFETAAGKKIFDAYEHFLAERVDPTLRQLLLHFDDPAIKTLLVELDESGRGKANADRELAFLEILEQFRRRRVEEDLRLGQAALENDSLNEQQQVDLLMNMLRKKQELLDP